MSKLASPTVLSGTGLCRELWWMFSWHSSSSFWPTMKLEIIRRELLPFEKLKLLPGYHLVNKWNIYFHVSRVSFIKFSSVQFSRSVVSNSLQPHELQHARPPCPSPNPRVHSDSCPSGQWCHPAISSSVFSSSSHLLPPIPLSIRVFFNESNSLHAVAKVLEFQL